jgi:hypothetical protein
MAKVHISIPDDVLRDARAAAVNVSGAAREGICARTYGDVVMVPADWYETALAAVGGDGPGTEPRTVWPRIEIPRPAQHVDQDQGEEQLGQRVNELGQRLDGAEGKLRTITTYAAVVTGILVVGTVVVYASTR